MTLLEALVGLVILGFAALGFLGVFQITAHSARDAEVWVQTVARAEAVMEQTKLGAPIDSAPSADGFASTIAERPTSLPGVEELAVTITAPNGKTFTLTRLVSAR
jgi:Tfp pilus assembly protein PilV